MTSVVLSPSSIAASISASISGVSTTDASRHIATEQRLAALREQAALTRTLLDEVDRLVPTSGAALAEAITEQAIEEIARAACRLLESAAAMALLKDPARSAAIGSMCGANSRRGSV